MSGRYGAIGIRLLAIGLAYWLVTIFLNPG